MSRLIPHDHPLRILWNLLVLVATLLFLFVITYRVVFGFFSPDCFYFGISLLLVADIGVGFLSSVKRGHFRLEEPRAVARYYLRMGFAIDLLAAFPIELVLLACFDGLPSSHPARELFLLLESLALVKLFKGRRIFRELEESLRFLPAVRRLSEVAYWLSFALHLMALGWIYIGGGESAGPAFDRYLRALYWVTTTIATIGYGDYTPNHSSNLQIGYTIMVELFGVGMFSYIIANVSSLVANLDLAKASFQHRLDEVNAYLRAQRIPPELQDRVRDYYSYLWTQQRGARVGAVLEDLPRSLSQEILLFLNRELVDRVELFRGAEEIFIREAVQLLRPEIFLPGEHIIRQGEFGDCMYFLTSGEVRVLVDGGEVARLGPGSPFGETALVENLHRNASVVSVSYGAGYRLAKADFDSLRARYPEFDRKVRLIVAARKARECPDGKEA